jgi:hypothetical protein
VTRGLCDSCVHQKLISNTRGSTFSMCLRHRSEPERFPKEPGPLSQCSKGTWPPGPVFPKYPRLPVTACAGYEPSTISGSDSTR